MGLHAHLVVGEVRRDGAHALAQLGERAVRQRLTHGLRDGDEDRPVLARVAGRVDCARCSLDAPLGVDVGAALLGVGGGGQHEVGCQRARVAVVALARVRVRVRVRVGG